MALVKDDPRRSQVGGALRPDVQGGRPACWRDFGKQGHANALISPLAAKTRETKRSTVSTVQEIEAAIKRLPREEFLKLHARLQRRFDDEWDQQMKADAKAGRLDHLAGEAIADYRAGGTKPFPPDAKPRQR